MGVEYDDADGESQWYKVGVETLKAGTVIKAMEYLGDGPCEKVRKYVYICDGGLWRFTDVLSDVNNGHGTYDFEPGDDQLEEIIS